MNNIKSNISYIPAKQKNRYYYNVSRKNDRSDIQQSRPQSRKKWAILINTLFSSVRE